MFNVNCLIKDQIFTVWIEMDRRTLRSKKSKTRNARPYDRPNQSILGKVASKVKGLLNPSWLFNVSQWMGSQEEDPGSDLQDEESAEEENVQSSAHGSKRPRLANYDQPPPPSIQSEGTQTWLDTPSSSLFNSSPHLSATVTQNSLMENKAEQVIINGDDHSENSEGSASTSGCSSLVSSHKERSNCIPVPNRRLIQSPFELGRELSRRDVTSRKDESADMSASRMSLWSGSSMFSPASKLQRRSPAVAHSNQPGFNVSAFVGPSKINQQAERKVASPFYQGKTSFGGASSTRRMPASVAPYQVEKPARNQIKVRSKESEDSLEGMSSAAKRILMTLEKMSSPVTDAKKIPNTNRSPVDLSLYLMPPKYRSSVVSSPRITKGPPIANISTITRLTTLKSCSNRRLQNTSMDSSIHTETRNRPVIESLQTSHQNLERVSPKGGGGGKIRSKLTQKHQPSVKNTEENLDNFNLPDIHLPIKILPNFNFDLQPSKPVIETKNPIFEFSPPVDVLQPSSIPALSKSDKQNSIASFTFSSPTVNIAPGGLFSINTTASTTQESSSELNARNTKACEAPRNISNSISTTNTPSLQVQCSFGSTAKPASTWKCDECWIQNPDKENKCLSCETPRKISATHTKIANASKSSSTWSCKECWVQNPLNESKCLACEAPKKTLSASSGFNNLAKPETWQCKECWVENPAKDSKCLACETPKSVKTATSVAPTLSTSSGFFGNVTKASMWSCSECWVQNSTKDAKCVACEAPNPSAAKSSGLFSLESKDSEADAKSANKISECSDSFKFPVVSPEAKIPVDPLLATPNGALKLSSGFSVSDWECDTCLVRNASDKLKCSACETLRPSKRNNSGFKDPENFKFNSPLQNSPITFKFGSYSIPVQTTSTSATFSFGDTNKGSSYFATASNLPTTSTKSSEEPSSTSKPVTGFQFGSSNMPTIEVTKPNIPVVDLVDNDSKEKPSTVFGSVVSKTSESNTFTSTVFKITPALGNSSDTGTGSFFTPPTSTVSNAIKSREESKSTVAESTVPLFKFGSTNKPVTEVAKPEIPVVDLVDDNGIKPNDVFGSAVSKTGNSFKIESSVGNAVFPMPVSTESKLPSLFSAKADPPAAHTQPTLNSTPVTSQTGQTKENPPGGFNFKVPTLGSSAFGGFSTSTSDSSKNLSTEKPLLKPLDASGEQRSDSPFYLGVSSSSISSPFNTTTSSNSMFKMGDKVESVKTTESSWGRSIATASTISTTTPVFNFGAVSATTASQAFATNVAKDVKPAISAAPFSAAAPTTSTFSFGNAATSTSQSTAPTGGFSFFAGSTAPTPSLFTFGATSNAAEPAKTSGFPATSAPSVFGATAPTTTSTFLFGAVKPESVNSTPATNFAFGSATATQPASSTFSGFQTNQPAPTPFQFGSQPTNNAASTPAFGAASGGFAFGAKSDASNQMAPATSQATGFGVPSMQQQQPMFGGTASSGFGKTEKPAGFNFGAAAAASSPFQFGSPLPTASQPGASQPAASQPTAPQPVGPQFNFGTPQQDQNAGQFQPQFNTPPTFNFGAASNSAGPFQFAAAPDNVNQPPGQRRIRKAIRRRRD